MSLRVETFQGLNSILEDRAYSVAKRCQAVERCLEFNRDNLRGFFEQCFSLLLKQIFGYQEGSSWLNSIAKGWQEQDAKALVDLLAPRGALMQAMQTADSDDLIKFEFPLNRLPARSQQLLRLESGRAELEKWPQYAKHIKVDSRGTCHVHLNVFQYFIFWTAFYVLRSSQASSGYHPQSPQQGYSQMAPSLGTVRKALRVHRDQSSAMRHPYLRMLQSYLESFLPQTQRGRLGTQQGFQPAAVGRDLDTRQPAPGQLLFSILVEFWLTDGDEPVPLPVAKQGAQDLASAWNNATSVRTRSFQPPSEDLMGALTVLVQYVTVRHVNRRGKEEPEPEPAQSSTWLPELPRDIPLAQAQGRSTGYTPARLQAHGSPSSQAFAKRLFRFLHRALSNWPEQHQLPPVLDLWVAYIIPWDNHKVNLRVWEGHVLSNAPFYLSLFPMLLSLLCKRVSTRGDAALSDLIKVLRALKSNEELLTLLKTLEGDLMRYTGQAGRRPEGPFADVLPFIADQSQEWEAFATAGQSHEEVAPASSLFEVDEHSAAAKARDLLGAAAGAARQELLREAHSLAEAVLPIRQLPTSMLKGAQQRATPLKPIQGLKRGTWSDLHFKGDWMHRPISSSEIGWLVRVLVFVSDGLNASLHLGKPADEAGQQGLLTRLRSTGWKVNLRPLGEKQTLAWLPVCWAFLWLLKRALFSGVRALLS